MRHNDQVEQWDRDTFFHPSTHLGEFARGNLPHRVIKGGAGEVILAQATLDASSQEFTDSPYLMLSYAVEGGGTYFRKSELGTIDGVMRPGTAALALPHSVAIGRSPKASLLGLAVSKTRAEYELEEIGGIDCLHAAASQLLTDPLIPNLMSAMQTEAAIHGFSTTYFDHAIGLTLRHLSKVSMPYRTSRKTQALSPRYLQFTCFQLLLRKTSATGRDQRSD